MEASKALDIANITRFYEENSLPFKRYIANHFRDLSEEDVDDIYQDSFVALLENCRSGRLKELSCSLSTYILQIGIHKACTLAKKIYKDTSLPEEWPEEQTEGQEDVYRIIDSLNSPCKELLFGYYYDSLSMEDLAVRLNYKDSNVAKTKKYQCMQKLKNYIRSVILKK
jgi:RNA polymerase sigma factor (sigma-70 family)